MRLCPKGKKESQKNHKPHLSAIISTVIDTAILNLLYVYHNTNQVHKYANVIKKQKRETNIKSEKIIPRVKFELERST